MTSAMWWSTTYRSAFIIVGKPCTPSVSAVGVVTSRMFAPGAMECAVSTSRATSRAPADLSSRPGPFPGLGLVAGDPWKENWLKVGIPGAQLTPSSPHIPGSPKAWLYTCRSWAIVSLPKLSTIAIVVPVPSRPCAYSGFTLYAARVDAGVKQRRPAELHCAWVGGVSDVTTCARSETAGGRGGGATASAVVLLAELTDSTASASAASPTPARPNRDPIIRTSVGGRHVNRLDTGCGSGRIGRYRRQPFRICTESAPESTHGAHDVLHGDDPRRLPGRRPRLARLAVRPGAGRARAAQLRRLHQGHRRHRDGRDDVPVDPGQPRRQGRAVVLRRPSVGGQPSRATRNRGRRHPVRAGRRGAAPRRDGRGRRGQGPVGGRRRRPGGAVRRGRPARPGDLLHRAGHAGCRPTTVPAALRFPARRGAPEQGVHRGALRRGRSPQPGLKSDSPGYYLRPVLGSPPHPHRRPRPHRPSAGSPGANTRRGRAPERRHPSGPRAAAPC